MKTIIFPTDFSETAQNAFLYALHLAKSSGDTRIYVLNCWERPVLSSTHAGKPYAITEVYQQLELTRFEEFQKQVATMRKVAEEQGYADLDLLFLFEEGSVPSVIKNIIERETISLVVMGTHGETGIFSEFLGSTTKRVMNTIKIPTIAVPPEAKFHGINKVAFTTLFNKKDKEALRNTIQMLVKSAVNIDCVYVKTSPTDKSWQTKKIEWEQEFKSDNITIKILEKEKSVEHTIIKYFKENQIDLVAVVKRKRNFFISLFVESISNNLALHSKTPIVMYHED